MEPPSSQYAKWRFGAQCTSERHDCGRQKKVAQHAVWVLRYLLRGLVVDYTLKKYPSWAAVDAAVSREGWKLVTLLRLSPIVPWNMLNYALSVTGVGFWQYSVSSAVAVVPWNVTFAYFGSLAHTMADVIDGNSGPGTRTSVIFLVISGVMLAIAVTYTTIIAK